MDKYINGIRVSEDNGRLICQFSDYIAARNAKNIKWSEKSFCDWCEKHGIEANG